MRMSKLVTIAMAGLLVSTGVLAAYGSSDATAKPTPPERPVHFQLENAAPSIEVLLGRVIDALAANDLQALNRLRVTEQEYRSFVLPGAVPKGEAAKVLDEQSAKFAWDMLNTNSTYASQAIIKGYGGRHYTLKDVRYAKGQREYAWYDTFNTTVLTLEDEKGGIGELTLGSIAHIDDQYKFVSLLGNR